MRSRPTAPLGRGKAQDAAKVLAPADDAPRASAMARANALSVPISTSPGAATRYTRPIARPCSLGSRGQCEKGPLKLNAWPEQEFWSLRRIVSASVVHDRRYVLTGSVISPASPPSATFWAAVRRRADEPIGHPALIPHRCCARSNVRGHSCSRPSAAQGLREDIGKNSGETALGPR